VAVLKVVKGSCPGQLIELSDERMVMGRQPTCEIVLDNAAVSRTHAQILHNHGVFYVEDLRSRNGTYLNGQKIAARSELHDGDEIKVCEVVLKFYQGRPSTSELNAPGAHPAARDTAPFSADDSAAGSQQGMVGQLLVDEGGDHSSIITSLDLSSSRLPRIMVRPEAKLRAVLEISANLARTLALDEVLPKILESLFKIFPQADRGFIVLRDAAKNLVVKAMHTRRDDPNERARLSTTILNQAIEKAQAILSADAASDQRFQMSESIVSLQLRSVMCAPLVTQTGEALGAIQIDTRDVGQRFSQDDLDVLGSVAALAAMAVENATLHATALKQRDLERELEFATQVQIGFLPSERPRIDGYQFFDFYEAAHGVGGDLFDYVPLPGGRLALTVGDVAGKGVPAALLMARIYSDARYQLLASPTPAEAMTHLNASLSTSGLGHRFITLAFAVLDPHAHTLTVVNAGHLAPQRRTAKGKVEALGTSESGLPVGISPGTVYRQFETALAPGDSVLLYTDGVTESMNGKKEIYGTQRLQKFLKQAPPAAAPLIEALVSDVEAFSQGQNQRDDVCAICLHRVP
jgi:phosphoserine phosphatase RsbU/P